MVEFIIMLVLATLLALALLFTLQTALLLTRRWRRVSLFSWRNIILSSILFALFFVVAETVFGVEREYPLLRGGGDGLRRGARI